MTPSIISRAFGFKSDTRNRRTERPAEKTAMRAEEQQFFANGMEFALSYPR